MIEVGFYETTPEIRYHIHKALDSGRISYGPICKKLEEEFAAAHECKYAVLSASGTDSLRAALHAMKILHNWRDGDEVIIPATTFVATANIVLQLGLKPVFVDVEDRTYCINTELIERAITDRTRAIIPVNLLGQPADLSTVMEIANRHNLMVVEDSCEAMFVKHNGRPVGSWGHIGCFSFYMAHLVTAGVGGVATTNDAVYADLMRSLLNHGRDTVYVSIDDDNNLDSTELFNVMMRRFRFLHPGYSSRMTELQAALALPQVQKRQEMLEKRRFIASQLTSRLGRFGEYIQLPVVGNGNEHSWMMYGIKTKGFDCGFLRFHLESEGIETRDLLPLIDQPIYAGLVETNPDCYPVAKELLSQGFYIGSHQGMTEQDCEYVEYTFEKAIIKIPNVRLPSTA